MEIITKEGLRKSIVENKQEFYAKYIGPNEPAGEMRMQATGKDSKKIFTDEMFARYVGEHPAGEMLSLQDVRAFAQQATLDITKARAINPTLYQYIYDEIVNSNFPETINVADFIGLQAVFGLVEAGESVPLANWTVGNMETIRLCDYACGYEVLDRWLRFNQPWNIEMANKALGIGYNAFIDHIHILPILKAPYDAGKVTTKVKGAEYAKAKPIELVYWTLRQGIKDAMNRRDEQGCKLRPTVALCNSTTAIDVQTAIRGTTQQGSDLGELGQIQTVLTYDGWEGKLGGQKVTFDEPADGVVYLIKPKDTFKSLVKTDLTQLTQKGNILRLSDLEVAQFFCRGVCADVAGSVHKVTLNE